MSDIQIPRDAVEAAARAIYFAFTEINIGDGEDRWERLLPRYRAEYREQAEAALRAGLKAWPGMGIDACDNIILPLPPKENSNAEA